MTRQELLQKARDKEFAAWFTQSGPYGEATYKQLMAEAQELREEAARMKGEPNDNRD